MTVAVETPYDELSWTGVETSFSPDFTTDDVDDVVVSFRDGNGVVTVLVADTHYSIVLLVTKKPLVTPIAMPAAPGTVLFERVTPALQDAPFDDLGDFSLAKIESLFDDGVRRDQELMHGVAEAREIAESLVEDATAAAAVVASGYADDAAGSASVAAGSARAAAISAGEAAGSASSALLAKAAAESARDAALTAFDDFDDRYLGAFAAAPATDNDGDPLVAGALYFDTVREAMLIYTGSAWVAAYVSGGGFLAAVNNLADVLSVPAALSNLGLGNVDNTSDADKPVSTAQVAAIAAAKSEVIGGATTAADTLGKAEALLGAKLGADFSVLPELLSPTGSELLAVSDGENSKRIGIGTLVGLASGGGMVLPDAIIKDQKATGVAGQLLTAGVYVKRDLNTVVRNIDGCVSLSSSQITFNASGFVHFLSPAYGCNRHRAALYDVTNGSYVMYGSSEFSSEQSSSEGIVAVLSGHVYELRHRAQVTSYGGVETNDGNNNVYSRVYFWKS